MSFEEWLERLDAAAERLDPECKSYSKQTGTDCWKGYWEDGYSPEDAIYEDWSYD